MATGKAATILRSKTDMSAEEIEAVSSSDAWEIIYSLRTAKPKDERLQVCFTGFRPSEKEALKATAEDFGFKAVSSVTKGLDYLVLGDEPGPAKIEKAEQQGVEFLTREQFFRIAETGEIQN